MAIMIFKSIETVLVLQKYFGIEVDLVMTANAGATNVSSNIIFKSSQSGGAAAERMRIDSSGNVGIGRVPDTVYSGSLQLAFGNGAQLSASTAGNPS